MTLNNVITQLNSCGIKNHNLDMHYVYLTYTMGRVEQLTTYTSQCPYLSYAPASCKLMF